jgi:hypothetical protein
MGPAGFVQAGQPPVPFPVGQGFGVSQGCRQAAFQHAVVEFRRGRDLEQVALGVGRRRPFQGHVVAVKAFSQGRRGDERRQRAGVQGEGMQGVEAFQAGFVHGSDPQDIVAVGKVLVPSGGGSGE